ncbi:TPA: hypothetical protein ACP32N_006531 [Pseudomonas aeruginosa]
MSSPEWITLHIYEDSSDVSTGWYTHEIDIRPSNIVSMTVICQSEKPQKSADFVRNARAMIRLNEPEDRLADDDIHVARGLRELLVYESVEQIRELMGHPSRNGLPRDQFVPPTTVGAGAAPHH